MTIEKTADVQQRVEQMNHLSNYMGKTVLMEWVDFGRTTMHKGILKSVTPFHELGVRLVIDGNPEGYVDLPFLGGSAAIMKILLVDKNLHGDNPTVLYDNTKNVLKGFDLVHATDGLLDLDHNDVPLSKMIESIDKLTVEVFEKSFGPEIAAKEALRLKADHKDADRTSNDITVQRLEANRRFANVQRRIDAIRRLERVTDEHLDQ
jgi:hypothetical protein